MKNRILIITSSFDRTCDYIMARYKDIAFFRLNTDNFSNYRISYDLSGFRIKDSSGDEVNSANCKSIYYRKPASEDLTGVIDAQYQAFSHKESHSLIEGFVESFSGRCLSKPSVMRRADNKILQAYLAQRVGFIIPDLVITNDNLAISALEEHKTIVKPLSIGSVSYDNKKEYVQTNEYNLNINNDSLKYSPAYFQKYISKDYEVRATFVCEQVFSVKIESDNKIDWRKKNNNVNYEIFELPEEVYNKCLKFMAENNINFGCFDFIINQGTWYFLEMNANGQWAWLEFETGMIISKAIVDYLNDE